MKKVQDETALVHIFDTGSADSSGIKYTISHKVLDCLALWAHQNYLLNL